MAVSKAQEKFYSDITLLLKQHAEKAIANNKYDTLLTTLTDSESDVGLVIQILQDLEQCISLLNKDYKPLIGIIMKLRWLDRGSELMSAYKSFILNLVSAHIFFLKPCLQMLVSKFAYDNTSIEISTEGVCTNDNGCLYPIHSLLKSLCDIVPMASVVMVQILESFSPYINKSVVYFKTYTENILYVSTYMPALRLDILRIVVQNMLKLDVRSSRLDISSVVCQSQQQEDNEDAIFHMDDELESQAMSSSKHDAEEKLMTTLPQAGSLDIMMTLTLQYIKDQCYSQDKLDWEATKKLYRELLCVFEKYIFPTHAICHVQYLLFYICSFREALADGFVDYLWKKVTDPTSQSVYRQSASCYIGSFLTRAKYLSINTAKEIVEMMVKWIHAYLDQICDQGLCADLVYHAPFYSLCQTVFYIFCFKHTDFMEMKRGYKWAESLNFQRIVTSKLNPLRLCLPIIVSTFASAARLHQLAFCDTIIERNNRYSVPVTAKIITAISSREKQLESYFPFDPYLLPRSLSYIKPLYTDFRSTLSEQTMDSLNEDEDDFLPSEDEENINQSVYDISMSLGKTPVDVLKYGTSPGFKYG